MNMLAKKGAGSDPVGILIIWNEILSPTVK